MSDTREVNLKLNIAADPSQGSAAMRAIAADAKRAADEASRAGKAITDAQKSYGGGIGSPSAGTGGGAYHPAPVQGSGSIYDPLVTAIRDLTGAMRELQKTEYNLDLDIKRDGLRKKVENVNTVKASKAIEAAEKDSPFSKFKAGLGQGEDIFTAGTNALGLAKVVGGAAAAAGTIELMANLTKSIQALDNPMLSAREKTLGLVESIPVLGSSLSHLTSNVMSAIDRLADPETAKRVDRLRYEQPIILGRMQAQSDYEMRKWKLEDEVQSAQFRAESIRAVPHFDFAMREYDEKFRAESLALQSQFPRGAGRHGGMVALPITRTLEIPGMPTINLPGMAGVGVNANEGGLSTLWREQPGLHSAMSALQDARRNADMAERQAKNSQADVDAAIPGKRHAERTWRAAVSESERRVAESKRSDLEIGVLAYDKLRGRGANQAEALLVGSMGYLAPEWSGANRFLTGSDNRKASPQDLDDAKFAEQKSFLDVTNKVAALEAKMAKSKEDQLNFTRQKYAIAQAETGVMQQQLSIIDAQVQKAKSGLQQFGMLDKFGQAAIVSAAERFDKQGRQGITQEEVGLLQGNQITAEWFGRGIQKEAEKNPRAARLFGITGQRGLDAMEKEANALEKEIKVKVQMDDINYADAIALKIKESNIGGMLQEIISLLRDIKVRKSGFEELMGAKVRAGG